MLPFVLGVIGVPVGLVLDRLVGQLAVPPNGGGAEAERPSTRRLVHNETGSLVIGESSTKVWIRRAAIVAATAGLFAAAGARYDDASHLAVVAAYICVLVVCASTDALAYRVPNVVTYPAILGALVVGAVLPDTNIGDVLVGGLLAGGVLLVPALLTGGAGMGMGDVKLAAFAGFALGLTHLVPALLVMALSGGAVAAFLLLSGLRKRGEPIPYAPFIAAGALAALFWQGAAFATLS